MPKLEWLEAFVAFAETRNLTHAARRLHLSQPAVHAQIQRLAESLGVTLYERDGRGLRLTEPGERVLRYARQMQARTRALVDELGGVQTPSPVVLAAGEGALAYLLPAALRAFARTGEAPLRVLTRDREGTQAAVRRGDAHLGIVAGEAAPEDLEHRLLAEVGHVLAMPSGHPLARRRRLTIAALHDAPLVVPPPGRPLRATLERALDSELANVAVEANGWGPMLQFVALGLGVAVVNGCCRLPRGVVARPIGDLPRIRYRLVHVAGSLPPPARALYRAVVDHRDDWRPTARRIAR